MNSIEKILLQKFENSRIICWRDTKCELHDDFEALNLPVKMDAFVCADLNLEQALAYLRNEALVLEVAQGTVLVRYEGVPLGFVKNVGNRCNNLYPKEWRIRKL